ncbi:MAG TPA: TonB-dependent receptor [Candidatus Baltobacteraceae bacterium]|jgi:hypothetical protein
MIWELFANMLLGVAFAGVLTGTVVGSDGVPAALATVTARGQNLSLSTRTDERGRFAFSTLAVGEYDLLAAKGDLRALARVELTTSGTDVRLTLMPLTTIHQTVVVRPAAPPVRGSGTDLTLNQTVLAHSPASTNFPSLLAQLPGAARGANGVIHINGDHGDINYIVDGVSIPQAINREVGSEFDVANAAYVDVMEGAYPAQYGGRFAAIIDIGTRAGATTPGFSGYAEGGSFGTFDSSMEYHTPIGPGSLVIGTHAGQTNYALDPPDPASQHNNGSNTNQFLRYTLPSASGDYVNFTLSHSLQTFQIPNDIAGGEPPGTDDNEIQNDTFVALQYHHAIGDHGTLTFGPSYKRSNILDYGDPYNDFIYGEAVNIANGGTPSDCATAVKTGNYSPTTCAFSLYGNSLASDVAFNGDYDLRSERHDVRMGGNYDLTLVPKTYAVTLQPMNFLAPIYTPQTPGAAYTVTDNAPNVGHTESLYLQDSWQMGSDYELDYGLREDAFGLFSTQFQRGFSQLSPRAKFTRFFGKRASVYAFYGRFFTPFSFQNVSPEAAYLLNLPLQRTPASFDLKPQRDSDYEIGGHLPVGSGDLGLRVMQKNATDLIDDTQVGVTAFHEDINYAEGRIATQTVYYQLPLARNGRVYVSANHTYSENKGCETQLLAPCFGSPTDWTPANHMQQWGATSGAILNDARGGWFSVDGEYGSGLSSSACAATLQTLQCAYTPHIVFDAEKGIALGPNVALTMRVGNLLNDRYFVTFENAQGNHYAQGRTFALGVRFASP